MKMILVEKCEHCHPIDRRFCIVRGYTYGHNCPLPDAPKANPWTRFDPEDRTTWPEAGKCVVLSTEDFNPKNFMVWRDTAVDKDCAQQLINEGYTHWIKITPPKEEP